MNYITANQFLELPKEIQKVFIDWWQPEIHDIFFAQLGEFGNIESSIEDNYVLNVVLKDKGMYRFPLLRLDQLWEFIEEKTGEYVEVIFITIEYVIRVTSIDESLAWKADKLEAFWEAAVKVASENWRDE